MRKLVLLTAMVITIAGCGGGSSSSTVTPSTVGVNGTWAGAVTVNPVNSIFTNYSVLNMSLTQQGGSKDVFGSYSTSLGTKGTVSGSVDAFAVTLTEQSSTFPLPFITPAGCTAIAPLAVSTGILTNISNTDTADMLSFYYTGTYDCNGTTYTETWMSNLIKH